MKCSCYYWTFIDVDHQLTIHLAQWCIASWEIIYIYIGTGDPANGSYEDLHRLSLSWRSATAAHNRHTSRRLYQVIHKCNLVYLVHECMHEYVSVWPYVCMSVCMLACMYACAACKWYVWMHACVCVNVCACVFMYLCMASWTYLSTPICTSITYMLCHISTSNHPLSTFFFVPKISLLKTLGAWQSAIFLPKNLPFSRPTKPNHPADKPQAIQAPLPWPTQIPTQSKSRFSCYLPLQVFTWELTLSP